MRRLLAGWALLCLLTTPTFAHGKDKPDPPKDPKPPEVRELREPDRGIVWWAMDGSRRVSGPYATLQDCQRAVLRTRLACQPARD